MTREEKISRLKDILSEINENDNAVCYLTSEDNELIESAIKALEQQPQTFEWCKTCKEYNQDKHCCPRYNNVIRNAVEEMKQSCEDAISRESAQEGLTHLMDSDGFRDSVGYVQKSLVRKMLNDLPSVQPKPIECEDAISRQAVLDKIKEVCFSTEKEWVDFRFSYGSNGQRDFIVNFIESLPSIQPKPKTGHWIHRSTDEYGGITTWYECSECGRSVEDIYHVYGEYPYCHCGAKMIEPQESEK